MLTGHDNTTLAITTCRADSGKKPEKKACREGLRAGCRDGLGASEKYSRMHSYAKKRPHALICEANEKYGRMHSCTEA